MEAMGGGAAAARGTGKPCFVGFYWTLPMPHAGFKELPKDAEAAAKASRTIRYQRDRVRLHVEAEGGLLVGETVWLELEPDRGSRHVAGALEQAVDLCRPPGRGCFMSTSPSATAGVRTVS